ncbi:MAG: calcium/sodium antiporter [Ignavibacteriales bacterium]|nr:calcium/sodium antiporter [Ignavibacteriales bacterium]
MINSDLLFWIIVLIASLSVLVKASDYFIESAEKIGISIKIPCFVIGLTIVAIGTSLPEAVSSVFAVINNSSEIVIGNVAGSNIANVMFILGFLALFASRVSIEASKIKVDLAILIISAVLLSLTISNKVFSLNEGLLFLFLIIGYLFYQVKFSNSKDNDEEINSCASNNDNLWILTGILLLSCLFIYLGSDYTIKSVIKISSVLNINKEFIAASVIALGTSLPELMASISAIRKNNTNMVIGNILGSNIFNIFGVMGISAMFGSLHIPDKVSSILLPVMLAVTAIFALNIIDRKITRLQGMIYITVYAVFVSSMFMI